MSVAPARSADGRFAPYATPESDVDLVLPANLLATLPHWKPPTDTSTPAGAFDQCKHTSAAYTDFLRDHGVDAEWMALAVATRDYPDADSRWLAVRRGFWGHYVTRVGDHYIDFTARQFDPDAGHPHVTAVRNGDWEDEYDLGGDVLGDYLSRR